MIDKKELQLIEDYLDNTITSKDLDLLKQRLAKPEFRNQLLFQASLLDGVKSLKEKEILNKIRAEANHIEVNQSPEKQSSKISWVMKIAAGIVLLLASFFALKIFDTNVTDEIYSQQFKVYPPEIINRGLGDNFNPIYNQAMHDYVAENYKSALSAFSKIPYNEKIKLQEVSCLMALNKHDKAINILYNLLDSNDTQVRENAEWYLSLCFIYKGETQRAINMINPISQNSDHFFKREAKEILVRLMKFQN